jgi:hypothetical protein
MYLIVIVISSTIMSAGFAHGQGAVLPAVQRDANQIRAERAKDADALRNDATKRPWDRDANGKRPWEVPFPPRKIINPD